MDAHQPVSHQENGAANEETRTLSDDHQRTAGYEAANTKRSSILQEGFPSDVSGLKSTPREEREDLLAHADFGKETKDVDD